MEGRVSVVCEMNRVVASGKPGQVAVGEVISTEPVISFNTRETRMVAQYIN